MLQIYEAKPSVLLWFFHTNAGNVVGMNNNRGWVRALFPFNLSLSSFRS